MMKEMNIGEIYLPYTLVEEVYKHRDSMIENNPDLDFLKDLEFKHYLIDYLMKNCYKLTNNKIS